MSPLQAFLNFDATDVQLEYKIQGVNYVASQVAYNLTELLESLAYTLDTAPSRSVTAQFDAIVPRSGPALSSQATAKDLKMALITFYVQSSISKVCYEFMQSYLENGVGSSGGNSEDLMDEIIVAQGSSVTMQNKPVLDDQTMLKRREVLLRELRTSLFPIWSLFKLDDEQVRAIADQSVSGDLPELVTEVGRFLRDAAQVTIAKYEPVFVGPGSAIDKALMKVVYVGPEAHMDSNIVCTVGLGLQRQMRMDSGSIVTENVTLTEVASESIWETKFDTEANDRIVA